jgi:hypothetical protein
MVDPETLYGNKSFKNVHLLLRYYLLNKVKWYHDDQALVYQIFWLGMWNFLWRYHVYQQILYQSFVYVSVRVRVFLP